LVAVLPPQPLKVLDFDAVALLQADASDGSALVACNRRIEVLCVTAWAAAPRLRFLDLSYNRFAGLPFQIFAPLERLRVLKVNGNGLGNDALGGSGLEKLLRLVQLELRDNRLDSLAFFPHLPSLCELCVPENRLGSVAGDPGGGLARLAAACPLLARLDIRHNDIGSGTKSDGNGSAGLAVRCVGAPLQDCTQLRELWLAGNPCSEVPFALAGTLPQVGARRSLDS
jgi:Leucine-rich repeat (LRR) protein